MISCTLIRCLIQPNRLELFACSLRQASVAYCIAFASALLSTECGAQAAPPLSNRTVIGGNVKDHADAVLSLMTYTTVPDVTTSSLSINSGATGNPGFGQS